MHFQHSPAKMDYESLSVTCLWLSDFPINEPRNGIETTVFITYSLHVVNFPINEPRQRD